MRNVRNMRTMRRMTGRQSQATVRGLRLIDKGKTYRDAAKLAGVAVSTLTRAKKRRDNQIKKEPQRG